MPDRRREFITGFTGSNGDAVVTLNSAAMWTDSRYYLQADEQMDCNWLLMKTGDRTVCIIISIYINVFVMWVVCKFFVFPTDLKNWVSKMLPVPYHAFGSDENII